MVATDTLVGIVGAVLLAGVMVGVFVYEYNNVEGPGPPVAPTDASINGTFQGSFAPDPGPAADNQVRTEVKLDRAGDHANITITYDTLEPPGLPIGLPGLTLRLEGPDGSVVATAGAPTSSGSTRTLTLLHDGLLEPGSYTIVVAQQEGNTGSQFSGTYLFLLGDA